MEYGLFNVAYKDSTAEREGLSTEPSALDWWGGLPDILCLAAQTVVYFGLVFVVEIIRTKPNIWKICEAKSAVDLGVERVRD